jgi:C-terminal processing protease CtpA/Prc
VAGSPAAKAKIRPGDTIVELAGRPIGEYTVDGATALLDHGKAGKKVKLVIEQDGKRRKLKLKLRDFV